MSLEKKLKDILETSEGTDLTSSTAVGEILNEISRLSRVNAVEKSANMSIISDLAPKIIYNLANGVNETSVKGADLNTIAELSRAIKLFNEFLPPGSVDQQYISSMVEARKLLEGEGKALINEKTGKLQQKSITNEILNKQMLDTPEIKSIDNNVLSLPPESGARGIEKEVEGLEGVIDQIPPTAMIGTQSLPPTMSILASYTKSLGYIPMGTISGMKSTSYVGIDVSYDDDLQINKPFPFSEKNFVSETASIQQSFKQYAGKTINAWNKYVAAEEEFIEFTNKVNSKEKREDYVKNQIQGMNTNTFSAQVLSTLLYYYVAIPYKYMIQKTKKTMGTLNEFEKAQLFSFIWFLKNYEIAPGISYNPLSLSYDNIKELIAKLYGFSKFAKSVPTPEELKSNKEIDFTVTTVLKRICEFIKDKPILPIGKNKESDIMQYVTNKKMQSSVYLKTMNIDNATIEKIRDVIAINPLRQFKLYIPNIYANSEVLSLINQAIEDKNKVDPLEEGKFILSWGNESIPAYDYVWGKKLA